LVDEIMMTAKEVQQKMSLIGNFALLGGLGMAISVLFPYFQISILFTAEINVFDIGILVWAPLIVAAALAISTKLLLILKIPNGSKPFLYGSSLCILITGLFLLLSIPKYDFGFGLGFLLNISTGFIIAVISAFLVLIATFMLYNFEFYDYSRISSSLNSSSNSKSRHLAISRSSFTSPVEKTAFHEKCPNCGRKNATNSRFCAICGETLREKSEFNE
jgi:hypothetical protein